MTPNPQTMVERVAKAGYEQAVRNGEVSGYDGPPSPWEGESPWLHEDWRRIARAAIAAMRESTNLMDEAAEPALSADSAEMIDPSYVWQLMIDAALKGE